MGWIVFFIGLLLVSTLGIVVHVNRVQFATRVANEMTTLLSLPRATKIRSKVVDLSASGGSLLCIALEVTRV